MPIDPNAVQWDTPTIDPNAVQWDDGTQPPQVKAPPRTLTQEFMRQLGLTGRAGVTGLTGSTSMIADALQGMNNLGRSGARALGLTDTPNAPMSSQAIQGMMNQAGVPQPEGFGENVVQALATMAAGTGDPISKFGQNAVNTKWAAPDPAKTVPVKAETIKELGDAGFKMSPSQADAGFGSRVLEGFSGPARLGPMEQARNEALINNLSRKALGLPKDTPLTPEVLSNLSNSAYQQGYVPITKAGTITTGRMYRQALDDIMQELQGQARSFPAAAKNEVMEVVKAHRVKAYDAGDAVQEARQLRLDARAAFKAGNNTLGIAQRKIADALEKNIELNLEARGAPAKELLNNFKSARVLMSKTHAVEDALIEGTGSVDALKLAAQLRNNVPLTGELRLIAKAGNVIPKAVTFPKGGTPAPLSSGDYMFMGGAGAASSVIPPMMGLAGIPAARYGLREAILSQPFQKAFVHGTGMAPGAGVLGSPAMQRAIPSAYPLFTLGEQ